MTELLTSAPLTDREGTDPRDLAVSLGRQASTMTVRYLDGQTGREEARTAHELAATWYETVGEPEAARHHWAAWCELGRVRGAA